ncbi:MAG: hypothetical protein M0P91_06175 [Sulfuricurvum sp.]|uniref:hypothetical protein n=1 Tax=Sulfuricurvum sp. TaxID=2025608 RepID=UPI0025F5BF9E|nr:hypothetical protein [Sulfuricurvum sp.]MCK9372764.1 hypothetical protein [Sulfuricurvum sp.]
MKRILLILGWSIGVWACTGDCMTCHPALLKNIEHDSRHKAMQTCIRCHTANPEKMADCGSDCFACHPVAKIEGIRVAEHQVIRECRDCHMKRNAVLNVDTKPKGVSAMPTLRDFITP